jgi:hypothetical protein
MSRRRLAHARASFVLLCGHVFQPVHRLAVEFLLNRNVRHRRGRRRTMPVLLAWRKPYDIAGPNLLDRPTPALCATDAGSHDQRLTERVRVPCCAGAGLKRNARAGSAGRNGRVEQRIDANCSCEPLGGSFGCEPLLLISMSPPGVAVQPRTNGNVTAATAVRRTSVACIHLAG